MSGIAEQKQIDPEKSKELMGRLNEIPDPILSIRQFIKENFDALQKSGKKLKALHDFFVSHGLDVGTYKSFQAIYSSVKRDRKNKPGESASSERSPKSAHTAPVKIASIVPVQENTINAEDKPQSAEMTANKYPPRGQGSRPVRLADGTEVKIDPNTGARIFDV